MLLAAAVVVPLWRQQGTRSWRTIFPEDGATYATQALAHGPLAVILRGYNGYLQLPARLVALPVPFVPFRQLSVYFAVASTCVVALLAWFVFWATDELVDSTLLRLLLAGLVVLAPSMGFENTANVTNTIWVFLAVAPVALVSLREGTWGVVLRGVVAFVAATATPVVVVTVPLGVAWALYRRSRAALVVLGTMLAGLALQALVVLSTTNPTDPHSRGGDLVQYWDWLALRVAGNTVAGPKWLSTAWASHGRLVQVGVVVALCAVFALAAPGAGRRAHLLAAAFACTAIAEFLLPLWGRGVTTVVLVDNAGIPPFDMRFSVAPCFLLACALAFLLGSPERRGASTRVRVLVGLVVAQTLVLVVVNFRTATFTSSRAPWDRQVADTYERSCRGAPPEKVAVVVEGFFPVVATCGDLAP